MSVGTSKPLAPSAESLEALAFRAWPAQEVEPCGGWLLRYTSGVSRRANSTFCNGWTGTTDMEGAIDAVESFYLRRGVRPLFQLGPLSRPSGLDETLARRGYTIDAPVRILAANVAEVLERRAALRGPKGQGASSRVDDTLTDAWFDVSARKGRFAGQEEAYHGILKRLGERAGFALAEVEGQIAAVGLGVCEPPFAGIFSMSTLAAHRRRGAASAVLFVLAEWAKGRGAETVYLQVETANAAARALYERAGFAEVYGYHYRMLAARS